MSDVVAGRDDPTLQARLDVLLGRATDVPLDDDALDDLAGNELEELEDDVVDAATAARTVAELDTEIAILTDLEQIARRVRYAGTDCKWTELRALLQDNSLVRDAAAGPAR